VPAGAVARANTRDSCVAGGDRSKRASALAEEQSPEEVVGREGGQDSSTRGPEREGGGASASLQSSMTERRRDWGRESVP